jgi:hypothetical protein
MSIETSEQSIEQVQEAVPSNEENKQKKRIKTTAAIIVTFSLISILCTVACITASIYGIMRFFTEQRTIQTVLQGYVSSIQEYDVNTAYFMLSPRAKQKMTISEFRSQIDEDYHDRYENYQNLVIRTIHFDKVFKTVTGSQSPQGTKTIIKAAIYYSDKTMGLVEAELEKDQDKWMIDKFSITLFPENQNSISVHPLVKGQNAS